MRTKTANKDGHNWVDLSSHKIVQKKELYIPVKCSKCGLTGKRYFPSVLVTVDNAEFIKPKKLKCNGEKKI